jgi:hypothetical protein
MSLVEMGLTCRRFIKYLECFVSGQYRVIQVRTAATFYHLRLIHTYRAVLLAYRSAKGLDRVFPIGFIQCGRV